MPLFRLVAYLIIIEYGYTILCFYQPVLVGVSIHIDPVRMRGIRRPVLRLCVSENDHTLVVGAGHNPVVHSSKSFRALYVFLAGHSISEKTCISVVARIESTESKSAENNHGAFIEKLPQVVGAGVQKHFLCENTETATRHSCRFASNTELIRILIHGVFVTDQHFIFKTIHLRLKTKLGFVKLFICCYNLVYRPLLTRFAIRIRTAIPQLVIAKDENDRTVEVEENRIKEDFGNLLAVGYIAADEQDTIRHVLFAEAAKHLINLLSHLALDFICSHAGQAKLGFKVQVGDVEKLSDVRNVIAGGEVIENGKRRGGRHQRSSGHLWQFQLNSTDFRQGRGSVLRLSFIRRMFNPKTVQNLIRQPVE